MKGAAKPPSVFLGHPIRFRSVRRVLLLLAGVVLAAAPQQPDPLRRHFEAAQTFQLAGDLERAAVEYHLALGEALRQMGNLRASEGRFQEAIALLADAAVAAPDSLEARVDLAIARYRAGQLEAAAADAEAVLARSPAHPRALQLLGRLRFIAGRHEAAAENLRRAMDAEPDFETAYLLGLAYLKLGRLPEARLLFDEILVSLGASAPLHVLLGRAYRETGHFAEAAAEFRRALALDAQQPRVHYYLGLTALLAGGEGRFAEAERHFSAELERDPDDYQTRLARGIARLESGDAAGAEPDLARAAALRPAAPEPHFYLERAHRALGREADAAPASAGRARAAAGGGARAPAGSVIPEETGAPPALAASREDLLAAAPATAAADPRAAEYAAGLAVVLGESYHNLGVIRARRGEFAEALALFENAARWHPAVEGLDRNRGMAAFSAGRYAEAVAPLRRHLEAQPSDALARQMLGLALFVGEDFPGAARELAAVVNAESSEARLLYAYGVSLVRTERGAEAEAIFRRLLEQNPDVPEVRLLLGQAFAQQGEHAAALAEFARALELDPQTPKAFYFSGLIHLREGRLPEAERAFRAELHLHPADHEARYHLAFTLLVAERRAEAEDLLQDVVHSAPEYPDAHFQLGKLLYERGENDHALEHLETAARLAPDREYTHYQLSLAYRRAGRTAEADRALAAYQRLREQARRRSQ